MYDNGDWDFKIDNDRMERALDVKFISDVDKLKHIIIEEYDLVGTSVFVELSYWFCHAESGVTGEIQVPLQISNNENHKMFTLWSDWSEFKYRPFTDWSEFERRMLAWFAESFEKIPENRLFSLQQLGSAAEYVREFQESAHRVKVAEENLIDIFMD